VGPAAFAHGKAAQWLNKHSATKYKHIQIVATQKCNVQSTRMTEIQANESISLLEKTEVTTIKNIAKYGFK